MRIGFFGLGNMGLPMAHNLLEAGHDVWGYDVVSAAGEAFVQRGGKTASCVEEAVVGAEIVISMLPSGQTVHQLYLEEKGILNYAIPTTLLIDSSTISADDARKVAGAAQERGVSMLDAPVSGGVAGAEAKTLTFIVGGKSEALERARSVLMAMGAKIFHAGEGGAGQVAKICNNMLLAIHMIGSAEAINLGVQNGLDPKVLSEIMQQSSGDNWSLQRYNPYPGVMPDAPSSRNYAGGFGVSLMLKDLTLSQEVAQKVDAKTPLGQVAQELYLEHSERYAKRDFSSILEFIEGDKR